MEFEKCLCKEVYTVWSTPFPPRRPKKKKQPTKKKQTLILQVVSLGKEYWRQSYHGHGESKKYDLIM